MDQSGFQNSMFQTAAMGTEAIKQVMPKVHDPGLRNELDKQMNNYHNESNSIVSNMKKHDEQPQQLPAFSRAMSKMGIALDLAFDNSTGHIAEMMIQGTNMGIIKLNKSMNAASDITLETKKMADEMLDREQKYIDRLKRFL